MALRSMVRPAHVHADRTAGRARHHLLAGELGRHRGLAAAHRVHAGAQTSPFGLPLALRGRAGAHLPCNVGDMPDSSSVHGARPRLRAVLLSRHHRIGHVDPLGRALRLREGELHPPPHRHDVRPDAARNHHPGVGAALVRDDGVRLTAAHRLRHTAGCRRARPRAVSRTWSR